MQPVFGHGQLRLYLLAVLADGPRSGYDVIRGLEERFAGLYVPSAGTVYPRLAKLEEEGLVERTDEGRRSTYRLTRSGRAELDARSPEIAELQKGLDASAHRLAEDLRRSVAARSVDLRAQLGEQARQACDRAATATATASASATTGSSEPSGTSAHEDDNPGAQSRQSGRRSGPAVPPEMIHDLNRALQWLRDVATRVDSPDGRAARSAENAAAGAAPGTRGWADLDLSWLAGWGAGAPRRHDDGTGTTTGDPWSTATDAAHDGRVGDEESAGPAERGPAEPPAWTLADLGVPTAAQLVAVRDIVTQAAQRIREVLREDDPPRDGDLQ